MTDELKVKTIPTVPDFETFDVSIPDLFIDLIEKAVDRITYAITIRGFTKDYGLFGLGRQDFTARAIEEKLASLEQGSTQVDPLARKLDALMGLLDYAGEQGYTVPFATQLPEFSPLRDLPQYTKAIAPLAFGRMAIDAGYSPGSKEYKEWYNKGYDYQQDFIVGVKAPGVERKAAKEYADTLKEWQAKREETWKQHEATRKYYFEKGATPLQLAAQKEYQERVKKAWEEQRQFAFPDSRIQAPSAEPILREFLEQERPTKLQAFVESRLPGVIEKFEQQAGDIRNQWWAAINRPTYEQELKQAQFEVDRWAKVIESGASRGMKPDFTRKAEEMMPEEWLITIAPQKWKEAQAKLAQIQGMSQEQIKSYGARVQTRDPLEEYLEKYPWQAEYLKLSPQQRGLQEWKYKPAARWFS